MPRPRILDTQKQQDLCKLIHIGFNLAAAAKYVGCSVLTIRREAQRDPQFGGKLRQAQFAQDANPVRTLSIAAGHDWRAAAWLLERTQPQVYARRPANFFSPQDVAELLDRVCVCVAQETKDPHVSARVKRRALTIANSRLAEQLGNPFRAQLASAAPTLPQELEPAQAASPTNQNRQSDREQPSAKSSQKVVLLRASDFARSEVATHCASEAS